MKASIALAFSLCILCLLVTKSYGASRYEIHVFNFFKDHRTIKGKDPSKIWKPIPYGGETNWHTDAAAATGYHKQQRFKAKLGKKKKWSHVESFIAFDSWSLPSQVGSGSSELDLQEKEVEYQIYYVLTREGVFHWDRKNNEKEPSLGNLAFLSGWRFPID